VGYERLGGGVVGVAGGSKLNPLVSGKYLKGARGVTDMISKPCQIKLGKDIISKSFSK